jgi:putative antitoxin of VapBC-like toxin-antitoxin system
MTRITVDVNDEWLDAARAELGTDTKVATINAALRAFAVRRQALDIIAVLDAVEIDLDGAHDGAHHGGRYNGGRDLSRLVDDARGTTAA